MNSLHIWIIFTLRMCPSIELQIQDKFIGDTHPTKNLPGARHEQVGWVLVSIRSWSERIGQVAFLKNEITTSTTIAPMVATPIEPKSPPHSIPAS